MESRGDRLLYILLFCAAAGLTIAMSSYHAHLNADTLITYLVSLVQWTPFYWAQDRYGMLIPALTSWITLPILNTVVQSALHAATSFATFFLLARVLKIERWMEAGALASIFYAGLSGLGDFAAFFSPWQIYAPAMMFGLLGLHRAKHHDAFILLVLAQWCNFSVNILLAIIVLALALEQYGREGWHAVKRGLARDGLLLFASSAVGYLIRKPYAGGGPNGYRLAPFVDAMTGWIQMLINYTDMPQYSMWMLLLPPALAMTAFALWRRRLDHTEIRIAIAGTVALWLYGFTVGTTVFAQYSGYPPRYLIPSFMMWLVICAGITVQMVPHRWVARHQLRSAFALAILAVIMLRFGIPSMNSVDQALATRLGPHYEEIVKANCTHIAGDYYRVWESVYYSRIKGDRDLWGITFRSKITEDKWDLAKFANPRVCYWQNNEKEAQHFLDDFKITGLARAESVGDLTVLTRSKDENTLAEKVDTE